MDLGAPISYLVLEPGTDVVCSDGEVVGKVVHVLHVPEKDIFDGIVIDVSGGPGGHHFVDAPEVKEIYERGIVIAHASSEVADLPKPEANPAAMENHGVEDSEGHIKSKLHRAWDKISGN